MGFFKDFFKNTLPPRCKNGKHKRIGILLRGGLVCIDCLCEVILYINAGQVKIVEENPRKDRGTVLIVEENSEND